MEKIEMIEYSIKPKHTITTDQVFMIRDDFATYQFKVYEGTPYNFYETMKEALIYNDELRNRKDSYYVSVKYKTNEGYKNLLRKASRSKSI